MRDVETGKAILGELWRIAVGPTRARLAGNLSAALVLLTVGLASTTQAVAEQTISLAPARVYAVSYEGLSRWCGPDVLIVNELDGQVLLDLPQTVDGGSGPLGKIDPAVREVEVGGPEKIGCLQHNTTDLSYWKVNDEFWENASWLTLQRLRAGPGPAPRMFQRQEIVSLPSGFSTWARRGLDVYVSYYRGCRDDGGATSGSQCIGLERINLATLDRDSILERAATFDMRDGVYTPDIAVFGADDQLAALVVDETGTLYCRIDPKSLVMTCRPAIKERLTRKYHEQPQLLSRANSGMKLIEIGRHLLACRAWDALDPATDEPMCREISLSAEGQDPKKLQLRAVLPDGRVLVMAEYCLSLAKMDAVTGELRDLTCLSPAIRAAVPEDVRAALVNEVPFEDEVDGVTIPAWDVSLSPTGAWIVIQAPRKDCGSQVPKPETQAPRAGIGSCGQVLVWRTDDFIR
jgi:hypothetical protein